MKKSFTFIDLFAGIGGLRIPFQDLNGICVFTSERDLAAREAYSKYFKSEINEIDTDVSKYIQGVPKQFPKHDLLLAGFPCQPFSHAGHRLGFDDPRGNLFFAIEGVISAKRPRVVLLENVRGLLTHDHGFTIGTIRQKLENLGYAVHMKVLNARDFGLPQNRNRLFIVAIRSDIKNSFSYVFPKPTHDRNSLKLSSILEKQVDDSFTISDRLWVGHKNRRVRNKAKGTGFGYQIFNSESLYSATLSARYYKDGSEILIEQKDKNPRKLTPREAARLQGFPENFEPHPSKQQAYKQFGNAVPIAVVTAIAQSLRKYL